MGKYELAGLLTLSVGSYAWTVHPNDNMRLWNSTITIGNFHTQIDYVSKIPNWAIRISKSQSSARPNEYTKQFFEWKAS